MKRFLALLVVAAAAAAALAVPSGAVDTKGPPCANIASGTGGYTVSPPDLLFFVTLEEPSCAAVTYTLEIYDSTGTTLLATQTISGVSGQTTLTFHETFEGTTADPDGVCVVGTTSLGRHVADRAPDVGCSFIAPDSSGGVGFQ